jgi:hypothetical protein
MLEETLSPKMIFDDNNNNTEDDGSVFYEEDAPFAMATKECMKTGTVLPLLKEELKCKILAKCHQEGKELAVDIGRKTPPPRKRVRTFLP